MSDYETGYKKPPHPTKFKPGQSGNPKGRPKGAKGKRMVPPASSLQGMVLSEAYRDITINEGGKAVNMTMARAIVRSAGIAGAKGQVSAQKFFYEITTQAEREYRQRNEEFAEIALEYKQYWQKELHRLVEADEELPELPVDPDYIYIDPKTGVVRILDPENSERDYYILLFEDCRDMRKRTRTKISRLEYEIDSTDEAADLENLQLGLKRNQSILAKVEKVLGLEKEILG